MFQFVRIRVFLTAVVLVLIAYQPAGADDKATRFELENGLQVMLRPAPGAAAVAVLVLFDIGEHHDPAGKSGLGHFVEHCYVTCAAGDAPLRTAGELNTGYPDGWNAQTGRDYTVVAHVTKPSNLEREIRDAAWRMGDLHVRQRDLERELPRVLQELDNMFRAFPTLAAANHACELVCPSPEGARKGGVPAQVKTITVEDVKTWHATYYKPRNARLVIAGNLDVETTTRLVNKHFGALPAGEPVPAARPARAATPGSLLAVPSPRRTGQPDWVGIAYAAPTHGSDHYAPFLVLANRLSTLANRGELPDGIQVLYRPIDMPQVLQLIGPVKEDESPEAAAARLRALLLATAEKPVSLADGALARAQHRFLLGTMPVFMPSAMGNPYGVAFGLARRDQMGLDGLALGASLVAVKDEAFRRMLEQVLAEAKSGTVVVQLTE